MEFCSFPGDDEDSVAPSSGGGPGRESFVSFCFCSTAGSGRPVCFPRVLPLPAVGGTRLLKERAISFSSRFSGSRAGEAQVDLFASRESSHCQLWGGTHLLKERAISFSSRFSGSRADSVRRATSPLLPATHLASGQESAVGGRSASPHASSQSPRGLREFCEDGSERGAFCTIQPYSPSLHHCVYFGCSFGATCTVSGSVACAAQPVSLAHSHNSTRLRDSVHQATSQVQCRSRDFSGSPRRTCLARGDC